MKLLDFKDIQASGLLELLGADESRSSSAKSFVDIGLPNKKSEEYRYVDIESVLNQELSLHRGEPSDIESSTKLIITDGVVTSAPEGVVVRYTDGVEVCSSHFDPLYHLGHTASKLTLAIEIDNDISLEIHHRYSKSDALVAYRTAIYLSANTHTTISETFDSESRDSVVINGYDIFLGRDATLKMIKNQTINSGEYRVFASHRFVLDTNSSLDIKTFDFGSASSMQSMLVELGERAHIDASHLLYASADAKKGTISKIRHIGEHSTSTQTAKNILSENARGIFDALIKVEHSAKHTKAHQNSKAILLNTGAYMASRPQLEIYIDELEASHGSTTGQLDGKQLFYLRSRGISEIEARKMLVQAFANELIDSITDETIAGRIHLDFEKAFYGGAQLACLDTCHGCENLIVNEEAKV